VVSMLCAADDTTALGSGAEYGTGRPTVTSGFGMLRLASVAWVPNDQAVAAFGTQATVAG
jgi:hypothetical protein